MGFHRSTRLITLRYLCLSSIKSFFNSNAVPGVMTFFSVQKSTEVSLYILAPWFLARESRVFDWANRHVPRKNAIERIESTIGKSDLGEKAWCLKTALRSLFVLSNLEASRYCSEHNWCEDMVHTWTTHFVCRKTSHVHSLVSWTKLVPFVEQLLSYSSCCSGLFQSWGTISVHSLRFKEVCYLYSNTLFHNLSWCQFTKRVT